MRDIFGRQLAVDDRVAFNPPTYKGLVKGVIVKFTPKMVTVSYASNYEGEMVTTNVYPHDVVLRDAPLVKPVVDQQ